MKKKTYCDITKDPNILVLASNFAEQHDAMVSFALRGFGLCDIYVGKDGDLDAITLPRERLEIMDRDYIMDVLNCLLMGLETKEKYDEMMRQRVVERIRNWGKKEVQYAEKE